LCMGGKKSALIKNVSGGGACPLDRGSTFKGACRGQPPSRNLEKTARVATRGGSGGGGLGILGRFGLGTRGGSQNRRGVPGPVGKIQQRDCQKISRFKMRKKLGPP